MSFPVAIREAEVHSCTWCVVQLVRREVVTQQVATVVGESQSKPTVFRMPRAKTSSPDPSACIRIMVA
jgi:hypothetical protein